MKISRTSKITTAGFTLLEVLVASGLSLVLGLTVLGSFIQSRRAFDHAAGTIDLVRATRPAMDRITQYLTATAVKSGEESILYPNVGAGTLNERGETIIAGQPKTWPRYIVFRTTEDFLDPNFDPDEIMDIINGVDGYTHAQMMQTYKTDAQDVFDYILWWEDTSLDKLDDVDNALVLARASRLVDGLGNTDFRPASWANVSTGGDPWADIETTIEPRIVARGGNLQDISFYRGIANGVNVSARATAQVRTNVKTETKEFRLEGLVQLPSLSLQ